MAGDDEEKGLLSCGGARPPLCEPAGFEVVGAFDLVFAPDQVGSLRGLELLFESFFLRLPNILIFDDDDDGMLCKVDTLRESPELTQGAL